MKSVTRALMAALLSFSASSAISAPDTVVYEFEGHTGSPTHYPGMEFDQQVEGKLSTRLSHTSGQYLPDTLTLNFANMPKLTVSGFSEKTPTQYVAQAKNVWIFRSVSVEVDSPSGFDMPNEMSVRVFVDYQDNYVGQPPGTEMVGPILLDVFTHILKPQNKFAVIDVYKTSFDGKRVTLQLNKHLSRSVNESNGMMQEGFELKIIWLGHGERSYYIPHPFMSDAEPFALISDAEFAPPGMPESLAVRFNEGSSSHETPFMPLEHILSEAFGMQ